jgi:hypothetical protein
MKNGVDMRCLILRIRLRSITEKNYNLKSLEMSIIERDGEITWLWDYFFGFSTVS